MLPPLPELTHWCLSRCSREERDGEVSCHTVPQIVDCRRGGGLIEPLGRTPFPPKGASATSPPTSALGGPGGDTDPTRKAAPGGRGRTPPPPPVEASGPPQAEWAAPALPEGFQRISSALNSDRKGFLIFSFHLRLLLHGQWAPRPASPTSPRSPSHSHGGLQVMRPILEPPTIP